jgi:hypothetical protein
MTMDFNAKRQFDDDLARKEGRLDHGQALQIFAHLWEEGLALGVLPPADPLEGIETDIALARILNSCSRS